MIIFFTSGLYYVQSWLKKNIVSLSITPRAERRTAVVSGRTRRSAVCTLRSYSTRRSRREVVYEFAGERLE